MASGRNTRNGSKKRRKKKKGGNIALFVVEIIILVVLAIGVFAYSRINKGLKNLGTEMGDQPQAGAEQTGETEQAAQPQEDVADVVMNEGVATNEVLTGFTNIALVGIDTRDGDINYANSDTMLIASINNDTWGVRMVSLYRDTYLNMDPENGGWNFNKCNSAYAHGSVHQFLSMLNANLDLNITEYVIVDMKALATLVDDLGGISVILTEEEVGHLNNYCVETSEITGMDYTPLEYYEGQEATEYNLTGIQAVAYARIRYTSGNDPKRTQRQRLVIEKIVDKAKSAGIASVSAIIEHVFPLVKTSFSSAQLVKMASQMFNYNIEKTSGFPFEHLEPDSIIATNGDSIDALIPVTLAQNVTELHEFLFDDYGYQVSATVQSYSDEIVKDSGMGEDYRDMAIQNSIIPDIGSEADLAR
ncbi:MAG: LCP family protein [Lachnospiraceae bacterium]|nr:LCP family protein [Lachnospiraceae bacterium]